MKSSPDAHYVCIYSPDSRYNMLYLRNYAVLNVRDQLSDRPGIGDVALFGSGDYAMRLWLDPTSSPSGDSPPMTWSMPCASRMCKCRQVITAPPSASRQLLSASLTVGGRFAPIRSLAKSCSKNARMASYTGCDVARVEIGASDYNMVSLTPNNHKAVAIPIFHTPGSNAIRISDHVRHW